MLSPFQIAQYKQEGYVILRDFAPPDECARLRERAFILVAETGPVVDPRCGFDETSKTKKLVSRTYFTESTNSVKLFFDVSAFLPDGQLIGDKHQSIVKIGHALHDFDPVFEQYSHASRMHEIAHDLGYQRPLIGQSRYFFRLPHVKQAITAHQDSTILYTEPLSCYAVWLALDPATEESGCMWVAPGSHLDGLESRYMKNLDNDEGYLQKMRSVSLADLSFVPVEVPVGSAVLMSGELVHKSDQNKSTTSRQAYAVHFIEGAKSHHYPQENWLQRPGGFGELRHLSVNG